MSHARQFGLWTALAALAMITFLLVMRTQYQPTQARFALNINAYPAAGRDVFEAKRCARCHGSDAAGTGDGPSLRNRAALTSSARLVTALWNHVPRMSDAMQAAHMSYPTMTNEQTAQLVSFLFVTGLTDDSGDPRRGASVFFANGCSTCHNGGGLSPASLGSWQSPLDFAGSLWNHAATMQLQIQHRGMRWPRLDASDLRDLAAYFQAKAGGRATTPLHAANPARGWALFQSKCCIACHALRGRESSLPIASAASASTTPRSPGAPPLPVFGMPEHAADSIQPATLSGFGAAMLNHFPKMWIAMDGRRGTPPQLSAGELADLAVFLYGLRNIEPAGSPYVGASVFVWRGCAACHGADASGGSAPSLRGRGQTYTAVRLATGLWAHGNRMYAETRRSGQPWPRLEVSDIGDLLTFLNTPLEK